MPTKKHYSLTAIVISLCTLSPSVVTADALDDYLPLVIGSFDSSAQAARDDRYDNAIWHTTEIWNDRDDARYTYSENWLAGMQAPYRQRITRYTVDIDGSIQAESFAIPEAEKYIGAWQEPARLDALTPDALADAGTCPARLAKTGPQRFEGGTDGQRCRNTYKGASYMVSRSLTDAHGVQNWDRGFNASGEQVWGPVSGPYRFTRQGSESCDAPVLMLVHGDIFDRKSFGAYVGALAKSGLYPSVGGYYRAISPAVDVFEGEPPKTRGTVLARFPCLAAAQRFWNSPKYQEIKQLRRDTSRFEVTVFNELPVPDYVSW
ncbi:MAG: hypothetical protein Cons2KO_32840 [Congregibacter sp.]